MNYRITCLSLTLTVSLFATQILQAKISSLSPLSFQERLPTGEREFDHSFSAQFGYDGVSPPGVEREARYIVFPYQVTYGVRDKIEVGGSWGFMHLDRDQRSNQFGITDLIVAGRYRFFDADRAQRTAGLDFEAGLSIPTASFDKGLGTGGLGILFGWGLILPLDPVRAHFGLGFRLNTENSDQIRVGNVFSYSAGMSVPISRLAQDLLFVVEFKGMNHARNERADVDVGDSSDELYFSHGVIWKMNNNYRLAGAMLIGLTGASSDFGLTLELQF